MFRYNSKANYQPNGGKDLYKQMIVIRDGPLFFYRGGGGVTFFVKKNCSQAEKNCLKNWLKKIVCFKVNELKKIVCKQKEFF